MMFAEDIKPAADLTALATAWPDAYPYLLQSAGDEGWDILFALPAQIRLYARSDAERLRGDLTCIAVDVGGGVPAASKADTPPFVGGWFVYLAYEWLETIEPTVPARAEGDFPMALLARVPAAIMIERRSGRCLAVAESAEQLATLKTHVETCPRPQHRPVVMDALTEDDSQAFLDGVARCKQYIRDGDVFQVNLSRGWDAHMAGDVAPLDLYAQLRRHNPAPFSAYVDLGGGRAIVSSSPERLLRVSQGGLVETRPIAGTHARASDPVEDARQKERLLASVKERAEHIMLIDLERNDLGRIAEPGTVSVDALMQVTSYAFVHHIESTVSCLIRPGCTVHDVVRAVFPGGTITGCPKVRCMQIIRDLEDRPRHAYTGSLGYINRDGSLDLNILIRTFLQHGTELHFRAGAGIVADSDPVRELEETRAKARGLLRALGVVE